MSIGPGGSSRPPPKEVAGSAMSTGVSSTSSTRRRPARAFWASFSVSVATCTGPDEERHQEQERDQPAGGKVAGDAQPDPHDHDPGIGQTSDDLSPPEKVSAASRCARTAASRCEPIAS